MIVPILLITVLTFAFIVYPFLKNRAVALAIDPTGDDRLQELHSRRDTTYSMLKELEFDRQSGILIEEDYKDLEARYKGKAISILKDIDGFSQEGDADDAIEKQVMLLRQSKRTDVPPGSDDIEDNIEDKVKALRQSKRVDVPSAEGDIGDVAKMRAETVRQNKEKPRHSKEQFCPQCGKRRQIGDRFCSQCGAKLRLEASD